MKIRSSVPLLILLLAAGAAGDVVHLRDGRAFAGPVQTAADGTLSITTLAGTVEIAGADVLGVEPEAELRAALAAERKRLRSQDAAGAARLCALAIQSGLFEDALALADAALAAAARDSAAPAVELPPAVFQLPVRGIPADAVLDDAAARTLLRASGARKRPAQALIARARLLERAPLSDVGPALQNGVRDVSPAVRRTALAALGRAQPKGSLETVLEAMLFDRDASVRRAAAEAVKAYAEDGAVDPVVRALEQQDPTLRLAAMDAAEILNDPRVVGALVRNLKRASGVGVVRSHNADVTHTSYVSDYDVEIAQAAVIAQPIVNVLQHGTIHDVGIAGVFERRVPAGERERIGRLLHHFTGQDFGTDPARWDAWLTKQRQ